MAPSLREGDGAGSLWAPSLRSRVTGLVRYGPPLREGDEIKREGEEILADGYCAGDAGRAD